MPTQKEVLANLVADVESLKQAVASLQKPVQVAKVEKVEPVKVPDYPIPEEYKEIVRLQFNKSFVVRLEPMAETPAFLFTIVVHQKFQLSEDQFPDA